MSRLIKKASSVSPDGHSVKRKSDPMARASTGQVRVLHIVQQLDKGAVENWLVRMFQYAVKKNKSLDWTFYCTLDEGGRLDDHVKELGAKVIRSPVPWGKKIAFLVALRNEIRKGKYDVIHCHHDLMSGAYLSTSIGYPIRKRIVHVHNADESIPTPSRQKASVVRVFFRRICLLLADHIVGISNHTLDTFLAGRLRRPGRDLVLYYGIDSRPFEEIQNDGAGFRREIGLPENARIILFLGRLVPEKNPLFALEVIAEMSLRDPLVYGVYAGAGSMESDLRQRAADLGILNAVRFLGWRDDVVKVMNCCDWFILPHPEDPLEGFGIAIVEAQLAGLRLLVSGIPDDPLLPTASVRRLSLKDSPDVWAQAAFELWDAPAPSREVALLALRNSPMDMDTAFENMMRLHNG